MSATVTDDDVVAYLDRLGRGDEDGAVKVAQGLLSRGVPLQRILVDLVSRAQARVGLLWQRNEWDVAQEHIASYISDHVVTVLTATVQQPRRPQPNEVAVSCVDGEWHDQPARLCSAILRLNGWSTCFLGASVPLQILIDHLQRTDPVALLLSCSRPLLLPRAHAAIAGSQRCGVPVIAGGPGFGRDGRWAHALGAAAAATTAGSAASQLSQGTPLPPHVPPQALPIGGEHVHLSQRRSELSQIVAAVCVDGLTQTVDPAQPERDGILELPEYLIAAVYVDDPTLFTDHVDWLRITMTARGIHSAVLRRTIDALSAALYDSPRTLQMLGDGRERLGPT